MGNDIVWQHEIRKVSELKEWPKNPRKLTDKGIAKLKDSLSKFGVAEPIVINQDNVICGGHGRLKALKELGIKEVPVYVATLDEKQFEELNIRLNKNIAGEWDFDVLTSEFEQQELIEWGFEAEEFKIEKEKEVIDDNKNFMIVCEFEDELTQQQFFEEMQQREIKCKLMN